MPERQPPTVTTTIVPLTPDVESTATDHVATRATPAAELPAETAAITATWTATGTATAPATATLNDLTIRIESADFSFGRIDASGAISSAPPGMSTTSFENGAYFMATAAVTVVVDGDGPWEVTCGAVGENGLSRRLIGDGRIEWRLTDADWNAFGPPPDLPICFQEPQGGQKTLVLDIRLFVASSDPPGPFLATLVFAATGRG